MEKTKKRKRDKAVSSHVMESQDYDEENNSMSQGSSGDTPSLSGTDTSPVIRRSSRKKPKTSEEVLSLKVMSHPSELNLDDFREVKSTPYMLFKINEDNKRKKLDQETLSDSDYLKLWRDKVKNFTAGQIYINMANEINRKKL
jgi:hypothetical protein